QGPEPNLRNKQCYVGCVATAMAQVMNYWQWPNTVPYGLPDYDYNIQYNGQDYTWHLGALPPTWFDWDNMADDYGYYVACPPAIPIAVSGEVITPEAVEALMRFDVNEVSGVEDE
ncbi:MAG: C10 family peptidase, partial [Clostridia bacterium]|nr:C10 family peptidase [Clostridia bacterium]